VSDVVVVGGGIMGCACAYELAKAGASVTLLEYGKMGMQATNAAAGMLAPMIEARGPGGMLQAGMRALREYPALAAEVEAQCGFGVELRLDGILKVAFTQEQLDELRRRYAWQRELGLPLGWLDAETCHELEPRISPRVLGGVFSEGEGSVSNQMLTLGLARAAMARGAKIRERTPVTGFTSRGGRVVAVRSGDASFACDAVVIAAGARSGQVAARLRAPHSKQQTASSEGRAAANSQEPTAATPLLPVRPVRGQMIALGGMSAPIRHVVWGPDGYLVPRANGLVFAGATVEDVGFRRRTTRAGIRAMRAMAIALVPQLAAATEHFEWAGLRPGSPDDLPMVGPLPGWPNVIAATGHYRNGILLGPLTGKLVARGIVAGDWSETPRQFDPGRFSISPPRHRDTEG
jgi:glycine oxidase